MEKAVKFQLEIRKLNFQINRKIIFFLVAVKIYLNIKGIKNLCKFYLPLQS